METSNLSEIKDQETRLKIVERTGSESPNPQGLRCPYCGAREVYADPADPSKSSLWFWLIRAFKIDDASECLNCKHWFRC